jgi:2,3-diketo-5-methylthio-1-phosphopentane phosphatase
MSPPRLFEAYFDFDNTIAEIDVLDDLIQRYSINDEWRQAEASWEAGEIGSRECLERQLANVRIASAELDRYLATIRIDPAFPAIVALLRERGIELMVVSDSFALLIRGVLRHHGLADLALRCNELRLEGDRPVPGFPYHGSICTQCANCKTSHLMQRGRPLGQKKIYVGDGRSDICPAGFCEVLFAKSSLLAHYRPLRRDVIAFDQLATVHSHLLQLLS